MTNPYQPPQSNIDLPPEPDAPKLITWAYVLTGLNWFFMQLETVLSFFDENNVWEAGVMTIVNLAVAWWIYQGIKKRSRLAWLLPLLLLLLIVVSTVSVFRQLDTMELFASVGQGFSVIAILVILFSSTGKAWRDGDEGEGILS